MNDPEEIIYIGRSVPELVSSGLPDILESNQNKLINLMTLKDEILNFKDSAEKIQFFGNSIPQLVETGLPEKLKEIETEIEFKKFVNKKDDKNLKNLEKRKKILIQVFKKQALGYLEADIIKNQRQNPRLISLLKEKTRSFRSKKTIAKSRLKAAERPEGVLINYMRLIREANKDSQTLDELEDQYDLFY